MYVFICIDKCMHIYVFIPTFIISLQCIFNVSKLSDNKKQMNAKYENPLIFCDKIINIISLVV